MDKSVKIVDVARHAGVSTATVSRVLSGSDYPVSKELADKIKRAAAELNYVPNLLGKQLKTNVNNTIGVIIPSISNPFYSSLMLGVEEAARKRGYHVMLCNTLQDPKVEEAYLNNLLQMQVKGVIISSIAGKPALIDRCVDRGLKIVAIDQKIESGKVTQIDFDSRQGGYMATRYLLDKGHRRIAYVTAPLDRPSRRSILQGYKDAMREAEVEIQPAWIQEAGEETPVYDNLYEFNNGSRLAGKLLELEERPTAVFCCNDMTAIGVAHEAVRRGLRIPDDLSLMGFDDIPFASMVTPTLSTIRQPDYEMGKLASDILFDMLLDKESREALGLVLQPRLVERESVINWGQPDQEQKPATGERGSESR